MICTILFDTTSRLLLAVLLIPTPTAIWKHAATLHNPKGWECEARSHLGSPLGELCSIGYV